MRRFSLFLLTIGWIAVLIAGLWWFWHASHSSTPPSSTTSTQTTSLPPSTHPYSIASLQQRSYHSQIAIVDQVRETARFTSFIVSFDSDGLQQFALMNIPRGQAPSSGWPVVVVNHGYVDPQVYSTQNSYVNTSAFYANAGFLVLKPDYRGHAKSEGEAGSLVSRINYAVDVLNLISAVKSLPQADSHRLYLYGHSMGGDVVLRVLEVCPDCVKAASLWAPAVRDWSESFLYFSRRNISDPTRLQRYERYQRELQELFSPSDYSQVSTLDNVNLVSVPIYIHHATTDESVPYAWSQLLTSRLASAGKNYQLFTYPGDNHDLVANWGTALSRDIELFKRIL